MLSSKTSDQNYFLNKIYYMEIYIAGIFYSFTITYTMKLAFKNLFSALRIEYYYGEIHDLSLPWQTHYFDIQTTHVYYKYKYK